MYYACDWCEYAPLFKSMPHLMFRIYCDSAAAALSGVCARGRHELCHCAPSGGNGGCRGCPRRSPEEATARRRSRTEEASGGGSGWSSGGSGPKQARACRCATKAGASGWKRKPKKLMRSSIGIIFLKSSEKCAPRKNLTQKIKN